MGTDCTCTEHPKAQHIGEAPAFMVSQNQVWVDREHRQHEISKMDPRYAKNVCDFLYERAPFIAFAIYHNAPDEIFDDVLMKPEAWLVRTPLYTRLLGRYLGDE